MAKTESPPPDASQSAGRPLGPGVLMVFGLACLAVAAYCGWDATHPKADWGEGTIGMNWAGAALFGIGAVYSFVLAAKRSKQGQAGAAGADSDKPPQPGA